MLDTQSRDYFERMQKSDPELPESKIVHEFFVDEAGDLTLFNKKGCVIVGTLGVSNCFFVGVAQVPEPEAAEGRLEDLRSQLLSDPYFKGVPSMQPERGRTAIAFHAKDDPPEVRREVFKLLPELGAKVTVALRRKSTLAQEAKDGFVTRGAKLQDHDVYDDLVKRLLRDRLHKADRNHITFARRGKSKREAALRQAINDAKRNFNMRWGKASDRPTDVTALNPSQSAGLQIVDYYLWAIQRLFERREDRFFQVVAAQYRLTIDVDDTRRKSFGEYYSDSRPLSLEKIMPVTG